MPKVIFWRDHEGRVPVILGKDYESALETSTEDSAVSVMTLSILKLTNEMAGDYFCHAENAMGSATSAVSVRIRPVPAAHNVTACCAAQNVSAACMDACSFYVDLDTVKDRAECLPEFNKLMRCAADGSDHRGCCARADVSRHCLDWCRGEPVLAGDTVCVLVHTKAIVDCFQSNRDRLPSAPLNVRVQVLSETEAQVTWEPPLKNPHMVEGYRIYWRQSDAEGEEVIVNQLLGTHRADTKDLLLRLTTATEVRPNVLYELVVKAGNTYGERWPNWDLAVAVCLNWMLVSYPLDRLERHDEPGVVQAGRQPGDQRVDVERDGHCVRHSGRHLCNCAGVGGVVRVPAAADDEACERRGV